MIQVHPTQQVKWTSFARKLTYSCPSELNRTTCNALSDRLRLNALTTWRKVSFRFKEIWVSSVYYHNSINYETLATLPWFKSQKIVLTTEHWDQIYSSQKEINYISPSNIRANVETLPPRVHKLLKFSPRFHPWHLMGLPPSFQRFCDISISSYNTINI